MLQWACVLAVLQLYFFAKHSVLYVQVKMLNFGLSPDPCQPFFPFFAVSHVRACDLFWLSFIADFFLAKLL